MPEEIAHHLSLYALRYLPKSFFLQTKLSNNASTKLLGLSFPNQVGVAAGLDKNGECIDGLSKLGFGFIEIGTVTPKPQPGNPKPRLFRLTQDRAIINRMGFNNKGVDYLVAQVRNSKFEGILGINIGKNLQTPVERAVDDYIHSLNKVYDLASYITVNVSSPNTPGLRELQHGKLLSELFVNLKQRQYYLSEKHKKYVPMLAKLAPDMDETELKKTVSHLAEIGIDGFVFSNTTNAKNNLMDNRRMTEQGGVSGQPLFDKSTELLKSMRSETDLPIIGVGGIMSGDDAKQKLDAGASLVQLYTGLIYQGPKLVDDCIVRTS